MNATRRVLKIISKRPQYMTITDLTFSQVDSWFKHCRRDLRMNIMYPQYTQGKKYPCIAWICGGGWQQVDKSAHNLYLSRLAAEGFVVASVEYRTSNEGKYPAQIQDVKAAIRYLRAYAERFNIDEEKIGVMGESAGGYLTCMAALDNALGLDVGEHLEKSSRVQAACAWYPPTDLTAFPHDSSEECAASAESLLLGFNIMKHSQKVIECSPISKITKEAPPILIIHGNKDSVVPYSQSEKFYEKLKEEECDVTFLTLDGADHADVQFFQDETWDEIIQFFKEKL